MSLSKDNFEFFVHGTNHKGAKKIIEKGILLGEGRARQDFSDGSGFYLGIDVKKAAMWARHKFQDGEAVLIYHEDKRELRGDKNEEGLDLCNNKRQFEGSSQRIPFDRLWTQRKATKPRLSRQTRTVPFHRRTHGFSVKEKS